MNIHQDIGNCSLTTEYHAELRDTRTDEIKQSFDFHNVVLDLWYDKAANGSVSPPTTMIVGTGSGTPARSDTALFNALYQAAYAESVRSSVFDYPSATRQVQSTFAAGVATGSLTECGAVYTNDYNQYNYLLTHAMFVDSEGNNIVIEKGEYDELILTATFYYTFTPPAQLDPSIGYLIMDNTCLFYRYMTSQTALLYEGMLAYAMPYTEQGIPEGAAVQSLTYTSGRSYVDGVLDIGTFRSPYNTALPEFHPNGFDMCCFYIDDIGYFNVTEDVFPPTEFGKYHLAIGDGTTTEYNIATPRAVDGTEEIYVDSVLMTAGVDYTFSPFNLKDFPVMLEGAHKELATYTTWGYGQGNLGRYDGPWFAPNQEYGYHTIPISDTYPVIFDLQEAKAINRIWINPNTTDPTGITFSYSTDGETWTLIDTLDKADQEVGYLKFETITAQYWKYAGASTKILNSSGLTYTMVFGYYVPSVTFTTPPAADAVIEVNYQIPYPFKNDKHTIQAGAVFEWSV